jgi:DNA-binding NarL/FixJ family response regulator
LGCAKRERELRVLLMSNQRKLCLALKGTLEQEPELDISGAAPEVKSWLSQIDQVQPDLVLLDWDLPGLQAADLLCAIHRIDYAPKVVVFSQRRDAGHEALAAGATAFICRDDPVQQLLITLRQVGGLSPYFVN